MKKIVQVMLFLLAVFGWWNYVKMRIDKEIAEFDCQMKLLKAAQNTPPKRDEL